jgi:peroxiredoxin
LFDKLRHCDQHGSVGTGALLFRLLLAAAFAVAAVGKLGDVRGARQAAEDFGVPAAIAGTFGVLLPLVELAIAAALVPAPSARWGAGAALALLLGFAAVLGRALARGETPDCHCFGAIHSAPVGPAALVRVAVLGVLAVLVLASGHQLSVSAWIGRLHGASAVATGAGVALALVLAAGGWVALELLRAHGRLLQRVDALEAALTHAGLALPDRNGRQSAPGIAVGMPAPSFELADVDGRRTTLETLLAAGLPLLLVFTDPGCGPCRKLLPLVAGWERDQERELKIAVIGEGDAEAIRAKRVELELGVVLVQEQREVAEAYEVYGTPTAVLVSPDGQIASSPASGPAAITQLVEETLGIPKLRLERVAPPAPPGPGLGAEAPDFELTTTDGHTISLQDLAGRETLLLFWNPSCGFCQQMSEELARWLADPPPGAPQVLVVSRGAAEDHRELGDRTWIGLDDQFTVGSRYGASGTPMAVMIDGEGRIATPLLAGRQAIMETLAGERSGV